MSEVKSVKVASRELTEMEIQRMREAVVKQMRGKSPRTWQLTRLDSQFGSRNLLILELALSTGLRVATVRSVDYGQVCDEKGGFRSSLLIDKEFMKGKKKDFATAITERTKAALKQYIADTPFKFEQDTPLFYSNKTKRKNGEVPVVKRLNSISICGLFRGYFHCAKIEGYDQAGLLGMHSWRKTCGSRVWRATKDINTVAKILGHANSQVTERYIPSIGVDMKESVLQAVEKDAVDQLKVEIAEKKAKADLSAPKKRKLKESEKPAAKRCKKKE